MLAGMFLRRIYEVTLSEGPMGNRVLKVGPGTSNGRSIVFCGGDIPFGESCDKLLTAMVAWEMANKVGR